MPTADVVVVGAGLAGLTAASGWPRPGARVEVVARGQRRDPLGRRAGSTSPRRAGACEPRRGLARCARTRGHPYAILGADVVAAATRVVPRLAGGGAA